MGADVLKSSYGSGTVATVTSTGGAIALGTKTPSLTLGFGTWMLTARVMVNVVAGTVDAETITVAVKDADGTTIGTTTVVLPTLTTGNASVPVLLPIKVVGNQGANMVADVLVIHAVLSANLSAGSVTISEAELVAIKAY